MPSPGDIASFGPSLHTPHRGLNDLSRQVGSMNLIAEPPLALVQTPAGQILRLVGDGAFTPTLITGACGPGTGASFPDTTTISDIFTFSFTETGWYLLSGQLNTAINVPSGFTVTWNAPLVARYNAALIAPAVSAAAVIGPASGDVTDFLVSKVTVRTYTLSLFARVIGAPAVLSFDLYANLTPAGTTIAFPTGLFTPYALKIS